MKSWTIIVETKTTRHTIETIKGTTFQDWLNFMDDVIYDLLYKNETIEPYEEIINIEVREE